MGKNKKQKITHGSGANGELSQAEIWDDSALIRSWNDAVAEYEYYHSIHARGEDVEEILRQAELAEQATSDKLAAANDAARANGKTNADHAASEEGEVSDDDEENDMGSLQEVGEAPSTGHASGIAASVLTDSMAEKAQSKSVTYDSPRQPAQLEDLPQPASSSDQTLENIKMAYYWAGYYSGLYDGQKQAEAQVQAKNPKR